MENTDISIFQNKGFNPLIWSDLKFGEASSIEEYAFLFGFAAMIRPETILEIGTSSGLGVSALLLGASMTGTQVSITTVDIKSDKTREDNIKKIIGSTENITFLTGNSHNELKKLRQQNKRFDLCIIDGGHDVNTVIEDWNYCKEMSNFFLFHDSDSEKGVIKAINAIKEYDDFNVLSLTYPPGHQIDDPTGEWYQTLHSPGFTIVMRKRGCHAG